MGNQKENENIFDRDFERIMRSAVGPEAPPFPKGLDRTLARRASASVPTQAEFPLYVACISAVCLWIILLLSLHPSLPPELRILAKAAVSINLILGPFAALAVIISRRRIPQC